MQSLLRTTFGCYAWLAFTVCALPAVALIALFPGVRTRRRIAQLGAKGVFALWGSPISVASGRDALSTPCIVVANHESYLDGIILTAALPPEFSFVIKAEMKRVPLAHLLLRRIGSVFVERGDKAKAATVARQLIRSVARGSNLAFFPEGTFDETPGLKPFRPGAFAAAKRSGAVIVPIAISGSRGMLPADSWLPQPGALRVRIGADLDPADYENAKALAEAAQVSVGALLDGETGRRRAPQTG